MKARQGTRSVLGSTITTAGQRNWVVQLCGASTISFEFFLARGSTAARPAAAKFLGGSRDNCAC